MTLIDEFAIIKQEALLKVSSTKESLNKKQVISRAIEVMGVMFTKLAVIAGSQEG